MTEKPTFPYPEHRVEVDPAKEVPAFDAATYEALMSLSYDEIEARAGEFGITPNSGIIPIEVDGERRFIDTAVDDFGTRVRNVVEVESPIQSEALRREVGDTALDGTALEATVETTEEEEPAEVEVVTADEFVQEANATINEFIDQAETPYKSIVESMNALRTGQDQMGALLQEADQYASALFQTVQSGNVGAVMQQVAAIRGVAERAGVTLSQQAEPGEDVVRRSHELDDQSEQAIGDLNASGYKFGAVVTEKMAEAQKDGRTVDKIAAESAFGVAQGVAVVLRRLQAAAETVTMDMRRVEDTSEGARQNFAHIGRVCQEILGRGQSGFMDTDEVESLFRMVYGMGEYNYEIGSVMARLQVSVDEVSSTLGLVETIR